MAESFDAYRARILGYLADRDPLRVQQATATRLEHLVAGVRRPLLSHRPGPGRWSIIEVVAHMADAELAMAWRLRNMLAEPGVRLTWFDEAQWARKLDYHDRALGPQLRRFRGLRQDNLTLLRSVPKRRWRTAFGVHEVRGRQTVAEFVRMEAAHDLAHLRQIRSILRAARPDRSGRGPRRASRPKGRRT